MAGEIFRREAIESMASPDRLDQPLKLVRPANWLFLAVGAAVILFALVWGLVARVPVQASGQGILIGSDGIAEIASQYEGRVIELAVAPGQRVAAGDVVARLSRRTRDREIEGARQELAAAIDSAAAGESAYRATDASLARSEREASASLATRIAETQRQLSAREETLTNLRRLVDQNAATREELNGVIALRDDLRAELRRLQQERADLGLTASRRAIDRSTQRLAADQLVAQRRRELAQLVAQAGDEEVLSSPVAGQVLELRASAGDVIGPGVTVAAIDSRGQARGAGGGLEAVIYAQPAAGKRIAPGMAVELVPSTAEREIYGFIRGKVLSVAAYPASRAAMQRVLRNEQLAGELAASGAPIEVRVRLMPAAGNASGYDWSSSAGPPWAISRGTPVMAKVVLERRPFLEVLLPGIFGRR